MALSSTMFRFRIRLSDVPRNVYETLELRVAMHPSEGAPYLLTRVIAYCLNSGDRLELTQGIATPDEPAIVRRDPTGTILLWIDVGNPSARRLHKASKAAKAVRVYTYRDPEILKKEAAGEEIHRRETIEVYALEPRFLDRLAATLDRDNDWELLHDEGELAITARGESFQSELTRHQL